jgi:hypothetical protein
MTISDALVFDVYGFRFTVRGSSPCAIESLAKDFAFFQSAPAGQERLIEVLEEEPDYAVPPVCDASICTPRNVVYRNGRMAWLDYHGRGLGMHDSDSGVFRMASRDPHLLYEACYLFLLSEISRYLDKRRLHRIHALATSLNGRAILVLLPMSGGKSTLAAHLLRHEDVRLMSDDSPYVDASGRVHAFPLHVGLVSGAECEAPERHRRTIHRMEFGPKVLVNYEYFADRVCASADPGIVFLGRRTLSPDCRIEPAGMTAGVRAMISNSVVGLGLFHGLEFILERSAWELLAKFNVAFSRLMNCLRLLHRSELRFLHLGRDPEANAAAVVEHSRRLLR